MPTTHEHRPSEDDKTKFNWMLIGFFAIAAFYLFSEHRAHTLGALPFLLLLACPLMHIFMHRGHDDENQRQHAEPKEHRHD